MEQSQPDKARETNFVVRLLRTTSFRFTLTTVALFMIAVMLLGAFSYRATIGAAIRDVEEELLAEIDNLQGIYDLQGYRAVRGTIKLRTDPRNKILFSPNTEQNLYIFIDPNDPNSVIRTLAEIPNAALKSEGVVEFFYERTRRVANENQSDRFTEITEYPEALGKLERFYNPATGKLEAIVFVARDISDLVSIRTAARDVILRMVIVTFLLGAVIAFFSSRAFLERIDKVNNTAQAIRGGDLSRRIQLGGTDDEFDSLGENLNAMLDQIERLMNGMRQVSDNIAHDLRSPLTRMRNRIEAALSDPSTDRELVLSKTTVDIDRLLATFNALLAITRIESGERSGELTEVNLTSVVREVAELYEPAAQDAGFELLMNIQRTPQILGKRELISQALSNLLDNAFKYGKSDIEGVTPTIEIKVAPRVGGGALLSVADNGPGVSPEDRARILKRFVRLEESRSTQGSGLGLSMVSAIAQFHQGELSVVPGLPNLAEKPGIDAAEHYGLRVRLAFPPIPKNRSARNREERKT